ncbi:hypothetical protein ACMYSQ_003600 [Aspergillus niger]
MAPAFSRVCFYNYQNGAEDQSERVQYSLKENPENGSITVPLRIEDSDSPLDLDLISSKLWRPGRELKIGFLSGTEWQRDQVKKYAMHWTLYANIRFTFVTDMASFPPDVLVDFDASKGTWSYLGTDCGYWSSQGRPSVNLAWIIDRRPQAELRADILHQFGHVLGRVHEDEKPQALFPWNTDQIYRDLGGPPTCWDRSQVDRCYFARFLLKTVQGTQIDPSSIMRNYYPSTWTWNEGRTIFNLDLSEHDKEYIRYYYPSQGNLARNFNTMEIDRPEKVETIQKHHEKKQCFNQTQSDSSNIITGINWVSFRPHSRIRLDANIVEHDQKKGIASIRVWSESPMYSAGMNWFEMGSRFPFVQHGVFNCHDLQGKGKSKTITFSTPFSEPPRVVCLIKSLDLDGENNWRFRASPTKITAKGFKVNAEAWHNSTLYEANVVWVAHPADRSNVASGGVDATNSRPWWKPQQDNSVEVTFDKPFLKVPRVVLGFHTFDYDSGKCLNSRASVSLVTQTGFHCHIQAWGDSIMHRAGVSYLAWED